ncbi:MAG: RNA polymerase sigma factor [Chloroflexota bacterium]
MTNNSDNLDDLLQRGYRYALSLTHNDDMAQELLQEACLKISRRGGPWQIRYFMTTIRNSYIDGFRRSKKVEFYPLDDIELIGDLDITLTSFDPQLESALAKLGDTERELLYLSVVEGYPASELAQLTDRPRGTILSTLHRAKQKLRVLLNLNIPEE